MEEKTKTKDQELEILDMETEIKEFVRKPDKGRLDGSRTLQKKRRKREADNRSWLWLGGFCLVFLSVILCGILLCREPALTVILVAILEALLSLCLCRSPIWLHGLVIILNTALGVVFQWTVYMLLASLIYLAGVTFMHILIDNHRGHR